MRNRHPLLVASLLATVGTAAVGAAPSAGYVAPRTVSAQDQTYLQSSTEGDAFEVKAGRLALHRSQDTAVRRAAATYVRDHSRSGSESVHMAKRLGVHADFAPSPSQQWEIQILSAISATNFGHWYSYLEVLDHKQDLFEAKQEVENGSNPEVVASARKEIPMLRRHLGLARAALQANK